VIETNWIVITGAPSSGKSSVIDAIEKLGYCVQREVARVLIEELKRAGATLEDICKDQIALQRAIIAREISNEAVRDPQQLTFLDRGMGDRITYDRLLGLDPSETLALASRYRCKAVFIMDRLPFVQDDVRIEDEATAKLLDLMLEEDYRSLGYRPCRVPVMPIEERVELIIESTGVRIGKIC